MTVCDEQMLEELYTVSGCTGYTVVRADGDMSRLMQPDKELRRATPVSFVPRRLTDEAETVWHAVASGRWKWPDHVTLGEGRSCLKLVEGMACQAEHHGSRVFSLQDNRPWAGAVGKGRSQSSGINYLCRRRAGICLAGDILLYLPWAETCRMPADWLSRLLE